MKHAVKCLMMLAALAGPALVHAQYMWLDDKGMKQLSDQPPPLSVPLHRILKQPRNAPGAQAAAAPEAQSDARPADTKPGEAKAGDGKDPKRPPTLAERNADFNKRRTEAAEASQKSQQEAQQKANATENCAEARSFSHSLASGRPLTAYNDKGERYFMSDEQRAQREKRNAEILAKCPR